VIPPEQIGQVRDQLCQFAAQARIPYRELFDGKAKRET
jgi:hypothetical protein